MRRAASPWSCWHEIRLNSSLRSSQSWSSERAARMCSSAAATPAARGRSSIAARKAVRASSSAVRRRFDGRRPRQLVSPCSPRVDASHVPKRRCQEWPDRCGSAVVALSQDDPSAALSGTAVSPLWRRFERDIGIGGKCGVLWGRKAFPIVNFGCRARCLSGRCAPAKDKSHAVSSNGTRPTSRERQR